MHFMNKTHDNLFWQNVLTRLYNYPGHFVQIVLYLGFPIEILLRGIVRKCSRIARNCVKITDPTIVRK